MVQPMTRRALWMHKIAEQIEHSILARITDGTLAPGASPGKREALAADFVTSGSVVDLAFESLLAAGHLEQGPGGTLVVAHGPQPSRQFEIPTADRLEDVQAILEMRLGLETVAASLAAERHSEAQLGQIRKAMTDYETAATEGQGAAQADFRFHHAIATASGNSYLSDLLDHLGPLLIPRMRVALPGSASETGDANLQRSVEEHRGIVDAIAARDAEGAGGAMRLHLNRSLGLIRQLQQ
ncbi:FadR/GntR family transcriptional regulator [Antarctobacter heliothermus]|uniref:DNA-binding transcriptional regulator, FadR family n=1 Tax=Antarctobacter heliothermus TaxID=74033 RepID=A0A239LVQ8_9RHOB|nr:FCD domain-containing protein [Antarctobacter heliothermus]SNT34042.1 DNA-binding transcriptional regulator, FadR family [Antarctobacter heliothermus]